MLAQGGRNPRGSAPDRQSLPTWLACARFAPYFPGMPEHTNRLAGETSPYLLQHAHNPVDWYPWGAEALERAKREDKPILLSIGYAACHWCHVMERESFENEAIAQLMNEHFVCIKVDREERPDLDDIYMAATVAMSGSGGWPMTVFLTPEQEPFFAGTYFPPVDKYGRPGFPTLLIHISDVWKRDRAGLVQQAAELTSHVREQSGHTLPSTVETSAIDAAVKQLAAGFDPRWGGFSPAPKFPAPASLSILLRHVKRTRDESALKMVTVTLDGMKNGGMYDHVAGGFSRYSTDERWLVPHFEKMLYDNAGLARAYLEGFQVTGDAEYRRVAVETLDYVLREMQAPAGGYYSATDADSEGVEGKFFVWQPDEIADILGAGTAARFCDYYDITPHGNWEGASIPNTPKPDPARAEQLEQAKGLVYTARKKRVPPLLDDKVLVSWNALMIGAMSEGARVLGDARYRQSAERAARFVLERMRRPDGGLYRTARGDKVHLDAYLEDYAYLCDALLDLYECGAPAEFLHEAATLAERMVADFGDPDGGAFFHTAHAHEPLLVRTREGHDGAIPNPNAVAARALARLSFHFDREQFRDHALRAIRAYGRLIERQPRAFATALGVVDLLAEGPVELAFVGDVEPLWREVAKHYLPNRIVAHDGAALPLLEGKSAPGLYVCRDFTCQAPVTDPAGVAAALDTQIAAATRASEVGGTSLGGHATAAGTAAYAARHGDRGFAPLGRTGLVASRLGFGGYRVDDGDPDHRAALAKALREGVNLVDTSTNYTDGRSERLIGEVVADLIGRGELARAEVIIVSKIGYVQGGNLEIAKQGDFPEMVKLDDQLWHCMHPRWLADQLDRSLARLGLATLDVCLVHNPEYFFDTGAGTRDEFYRRLEHAFAHFEKEVERGRIRSYGVSSNTSVAPEGDKKATSLARMLEAARRAGGEEHHFRVLQLPANLIEGGAVLEKNNDGKTVLALAHEREVAVLVNRPLNAIVDGKLLRLADPPELDPPPPFDAQLAKVEQLEQEFGREIAPHVEVGKGSVPATRFFVWADQLRSLPATLESLDQWREIESRAVAPRVGHVFRMLDRALQGELADRWRDWRGRYIRELDGLMAALRARAADRSRARSAKIARVIDPLLPEARRSAPLSQKALWALASVPGVSTVLVGMRRPDYVDDALAMIQWEPLPQAERVFVEVGK